MKFFIDTANILSIKEGLSLGVLDGVTTNPSLMAKENIKGRKAILDHYRAICELVGDLPVSAEVIATDFKEMIEEATTLSKIAPNIVIKIPMIKDGIQTCKYLSDKGIKTNVTLVFSAGQALLATKAGATYVSPFIGRLDDIDIDGVSLIEDIRTIFDNYGYSTEILAASIRNKRHITACAKVGADVITAPLSVINSLLKHPLTDNGLQRFLEDYKKTVL